MKKQTKISTNLAWALIILGGIIECFWVNGLKHADNFALYVFTGLGILISFCCTILAMKKIEVSIAYAVFVGIGTAGVVLGEMLIFNEPFSWLKISLISVLILSVIGLKFISQEHDEESVEKISSDLGLNELEDELLGKIK
ncbi:QacE family quaternary ammonium compound efflux SMR transporter [Campylobacter sp. MIT 97-5078]|nr:quaternary ammonium compound resistance protein [Campylobacter sp. MIT 97-5078]TQR27118.1 QacE family quaternary ammonium compound efflux SMR transporter [Campylobacter sp. MIT 97-5078]